jgi:sensor histidine kinase YesM
MKFTGLILILFLPSFCISQTAYIDSLKKVLPSLKGESRIDCLNELGSEFSDRYQSKSKYQQTDTAYMYTLQARNESQQLHYLKGIGRAMQNMGYIEEGHGNLKAGEDYTRKAIPILQKENMQAQYHRACVFLGWILHNRGFFTQSIQIYQKELPYYKAINDSVHIANLYRMTARAYDLLGNSENAFIYFQKDFAIQKKPEDAWGKRSTATLKASVYLAAGDTANAVFYYKQAGYFSTVYKLQKKYDSALIDIRESIMRLQSSDKDLLYRKAVLMTNYKDLIDIFFSLQKFDSAIIFGHQLISFTKEGDNIVALMPVLKIVASSYHSKNENKNALVYTNQLLAYAQSAGARRFVKDAYQLLWHIYEEESKKSIANNYQLKYLLLNDSLEKDKYISQSAAWKAINDLNTTEANYQNRLKINTERNSARIALINREKKTQLYVFIAAIALIGLFMILIVRNTKLQRKKEQLQLMMTRANNLIEKQKREQEVAQLHQQKSDLEMQALRAQMNPHFIFNCLSSINRFILINKIDEASDYLTKFSRLIRMALHNSEKSLITLESELEALRLYLDLERLRFKNAFNYSITFINAIDINAVYIPPMLIQPFAENAIWHGLMHKKGIGCLEIQLCAEDKTLTCVIIDNGIGRKMAASLNSRSAEKNKSMGVEITAGRLALLNKSKKEAVVFNVEDLMDEEGKGCGTKVILAIPYKDLTEVVA